MAAFDQGNAIDGHTFSHEIEVTTTPAKVVGRERREHAQTGEA